MLTAYILHILRLLPQVWGRLVNSAGQKFQTSTIYIRNENATRCTAYSNTSGIHVDTCFELSAKIDLSFPFGVAVNSLLSIT